MSQVYNKLVYNNNNNNNNNNNKTSIISVQCTD